jgi:hypothetical protein
LKRPRAFAAVPISIPQCEPRHPRFRGKTDEKGRPDLLGKHLKRMELARENAAAFRSHLKLANVQIDGALVFAHTVPMSFTAERIGHTVTLLTYDQLEMAFGRHVEA